MSKLTTLYDCLMAGDRLNYEKKQKEIIQIINEIHRYNIGYMLEHIHEGGIQWTNFKKGGKNE